LTVGLLGSVQHSARGTIFPQPLLLLASGETVRMDDVYPAGWKLVFSAQEDEAALNASQQHNFKHLQVLKLGSPELTEAEGVLAQWFEKHAVIAAIVRPDHYIYGVCPTSQDVRTQLQALNLY